MATTMATKLSLPMRRVVDALEFLGTPTVTIRVPNAEIEGEHIDYEVHWTMLKHMVDRVWHDEQGRQYSSVCTEDRPSVIPLQTTPFVLGSFITWLYGGIISGPEPWKHLHLMWKFATEDGGMPEFQNYLVDWCRANVDQSQRAFVLHCLVLDHVSTGRLLEYLVAKIGFDQAVQEPQAFLEASGNAWEDLQAMQDCSECCKDRAMVKIAQDKRDTSQARREGRLVPDPGHPMYCWYEHQSVGERQGCRGYHWRG